MLRGMILGKFMPPHRGHMHLIDRALSMCDDLTIVVGTMADEPIPGPLRCEWMRRLYPRCRIVHLTDENPQYPHEHPDFWDIWRTSLLRVLPFPPDVVFSSESYGDRLAAELGAARHVCVDPERRAVAVSGTAARNDPVGNWDHIAYPARPWFVKRVCVYGAESTGKTTLARALAERYGTVWVAEYARPLLEQKGRGDPFVLAEDIPEIAFGHARAEDGALSLARGVLFVDTDLITTTIYSDFYFGGCPAWIRREADRRTYDLYLLLDVDVPWVADPLRDQPRDRDVWMRRFREELEQRARRCALISGTWEERLARSCAAVDRLMEEKPCSSGSS